MKTIRLLAIALSLACAASTTATALIPPIKNDSVITVPIRDTDNTDVIALNYDVVRPIRSGDFKTLGIDRFALLTPQELKDCRVITRHASHTGPYSLMCYEIVTRAGMKHTYLATYVHDRLFDAMLIAHSGDAGQFKRNDDDGFYVDTNDALITFNDDNVLVTRKYNVDTDKGNMREKHDCKITDIYNVKLPAVMFDKHDYYSIVTTVVFMHDKAHTDRNVFQIANCLRDTIAEKIMDLIHQPVGYSHVPLLWSNLADVITDLQFGDKDVPQAVKDDVKYFNTWLARAVMREPELFMTWMWQHNEDTVLSECFLDGVRLLGGDTLENCRTKARALSNAEARGWWEDTFTKFKTILEAQQH